MALSVQIFLKCSFMAYIPQLSDLEEGIYLQEAFRLETGFELRSFFCPVLF